MTTVPYHTYRMGGGKEISSEREPKRAKAASGSDSEEVDTTGLSSSPSTFLPGSRDDVKVSKNIPRGFLRTLSCSGEEFREAIAADCKQITSSEDEGHSDEESSSEVEGSSEDEGTGATYLNWVRRRPNRRTAEIQRPPAAPQHTQMFSVADSCPAEIEWRGIVLDTKSDEETDCDDNTDLEETALSNTAKSCEDVAHEETDCDDNTDLEETALSNTAKSCEDVAHDEKSVVTSKKLWSNGESESAISLNMKAALRGERQQSLIVKYSLGSALGWDLQGEPVKPKYTWGNAHLKAENYSCLIRSDWLSGVRVQGLWVWFTRFPPPDEYAYTVISPSGKGETLVLEMSNLDKILSDERRKPDEKWIQLELYCAPSFYDSKLFMLFM